MEVHLRKAATTTPACRAEIQRSTMPVREVPLEFEDQRRDRSPLVPPGQRHGSLADPASAGH